MLTTARRWWFAQIAIEQFLLNRPQIIDAELVIITEDDPSDLIALAAHHKQIRVVVCDRDLPVAEKRNRGVAACRGPWVTLWDDDDWRGVQWLNMLRTNLRGGDTRRYGGVAWPTDPEDAREAQIIGARGIYFQELLGKQRTFWYEYPFKKLETDPYVVGGTLMFKKTLWEKQPFTTEVTGGDEGWWTLKQLRQQRVPYALIDGSSYVAMLHGKNTCSPNHLRVADDGKQVLDDSHMTALSVEGPAKEIWGVLPAPVFARYVAAAWAQSGEQE